MNQIDGPVVRKTRGTQGAETDLRFHSQSVRISSVCDSQCPTYACWIIMLDDDPVVAPAELAERERTGFGERGFAVFDRILSVETCDLLNGKLEGVLRGTCDGSFGKADKTPTRLLQKDMRCKPGKAKAAKVAAPLGGPSKQTLQVINVWKADRDFARVVLSPTLGRIVAALGGWANGARVANDQVWAKPPGAAPLTFHRDSAYFDFVPSDVITVWIALDDMEPELGPLQYVHGSHEWGDARVGSAQQFFDHRDRFALLHDAARRAGISDPASQLSITTLAVRAGGCGIHNGRLWHGSGANASASKPRRGLGIHFVPAEARLRTALGRTLAHLQLPHPAREQPPHQSDSGTTAGTPISDTNDSRRADDSGSGDIIRQHESRERCHSTQAGELALPQYLFPVTWPSSAACTAVVLVIRPQGSRSVQVSVSLL